MGGGSATHPSKRRYRGPPGYHVEAQQYGYGLMGVAKRLQRRLEKEANQAKEARHRATLRKRAGHHQSSQSSDGLSRDASELCASGDDIKPKTSTTAMREDPQIESMITASASPGPGASSDSANSSPTERKNQAERIGRKANSSSSSSQIAASLPSPGASGLSAAQSSRRTRSVGMSKTQPLSSGAVDLSGTESSTGAMPQTQYSMMGSPRAAGPSSSKELSGQGMEESDALQLSGAHPQTEQTHFAKMESPRTDGGSQVGILKKDHGSSTKCFHETEVLADSGQEVESTDASHVHGAKGRGDAASFGLDPACVKERQNGEASRHQLRFALFDHDVLTLQMATLKLQEFRVSLLSRFRSPSKAFEKLAGSTKMDSTIELRGLPEKAAKLLSFNALDARRAVELLATVEATEDLSALSYGHLLHVFRFASPVRSLLGLHTRLVQRYVTVDAGLRILGFGPGTATVDVGVFEKRVVAAGIVSADAHRLFVVAESAQPGGQELTELTAAGFRFSMEHAHVLAWLEIFHARLLANGLDPQDALLGAQMSGGAAGQGRRKPKVLDTADDLRHALEPLGFPADCAAATFQFLQARASSGQVMLGTFAKLMHDAFDKIVVTESRARKSLWKKQKTAPVPAPVSARKGVSKPILKTQSSQEGLQLGNVGAGSSRPMLKKLNSQEGAQMGNLGVGSNHSPFAPLSTAAALAHVQDDVRAAALLKVIQLRSYVMSAFQNTEEAYKLFGKWPTSESGISFLMWMEAMTKFDSFADDAAGWELIYGHMIDFQDTHWDMWYRGAPAMLTLEMFVTALGRAAPCRTLSSLRVVLLRNFRSLPEAWLRFSGGADEVNLSMWVKAMLHLSIHQADAQELWALLHAVPCVERTHNHHRILRAIFMTAMKGADPITKLFDLLRLHPLLGLGLAPVSRGFEGGCYAPGLLPSGAFEEELVRLFGISLPDARAIFAFLDVHHDGSLEIDDLLDALTVMQSSYIPHSVTRPGDMVATGEKEEPRKHEAVVVATMERSGISITETTLSKPETIMQGSCPSELPGRSTSASSASYPESTTPAPGRSSRSARASSASRAESMTSALDRSASLGSESRPESATPAPSTSRAASASSTSHPESTTLAPHKDSEGNASPLLTLSKDDGHRRHVQSALAHVPDSAAARPGSRVTFGAEDIASAPITPMDVKGQRGTFDDRPGSSGFASTALASTALPEDSDSDQEERDGTKSRSSSSVGRPPQRPWTSMSSTAPRISRPPVQLNAEACMVGVVQGIGSSGGRLGGSRDRGSERPGPIRKKATAPLPHLDLAGEDQRAGPRSGSLGSALTSRRVETAARMQEVGSRTDRRAETVATLEEVGSARPGVPPPPSGRLADALPMLAVANLPRNETGRP